MIFKVFILLLTITILCEFSTVQSKLMDCRNGEIYWCRTRRTAKQCDKEAYCYEILHKSPDVVIAAVTEDPKDNLANLFLDMMELNQPKQSTPSQISNFPVENDHNQDSMPE